MAENEGDKIAYGVLCPECRIDREAVQFKYRGVYFLLYRCPNCLKSGLPYLTGSRKSENIPEIFNIDDEKIIARMDSSIADMQRALREQS